MISRGRFSYALGDAQRFVSPKHHNYQVRLRKYLESKGVVADFEKDFIDVQFVASSHRFIGEIKVTGWLTLEQAFRLALGQLYEYAHMKFSEPVEMVMLLDRSPGEARLQLATQLSIAVVVEQGSNFSLLNSVSVPQLSTIFPKVDAASSMVVAQK
jgi:hypothetical protein